MSFQITNYESSIDCLTKSGNDPRNHFSFCVQTFRNNQEHFFLYNNLKYGFRKYIIYYLDTNLLGERENTEGEYLKSIIIENIKY